MTLMADLAALQQVDSELDRLRRRAADVRALIADDTALRERRALREAVASSLQQHQLRQRQLEGDSAATEREIQRREQRLNSPSLQDEHAYRATQAELEEHTRRLRQLDGDLLATMDDVEVTDRRLREVERDVAEAARDRERRLVDWRTELADLTTQIAVQEEERTRRLAPLPAGALQQYDRLRQQKGGRAVAVVNGNVCTACRVVVPPPTLARARPGIAFVPCDNCGRWLYVSR